MVRTSIVLADELAERFKATAHERGQSLSAFLAEAGKAALAQETAGPAKPFALITQGGPGPQPGVDLDKTSALLAAEDEAAFGGRRS